MTDHTNTSKTASLHAAARTSTENRPNGHIDGLENLSADERAIVRQSDEAFVDVSRTWSHWMKVRAGLAILRDVAMRETGSRNDMSKLHKNRFHELLACCSYRNMADTTTKVLLSCADVAPAIDDWHAGLSEDRRLRLNHPDTVLRAFREEHNPKQAPRLSRRESREAELESVWQQAAAAMSAKDAQIKERDKQIEKLTKHIAARSHTAVGPNAKRDRPDRAGRKRPDSGDRPNVSKTTSLQAAVVSKRKSK